MDVKKEIKKDHFTHYICPCGLKAFGNRLLYTKYTVDLQSNTYPSVMEIIGGDKETSPLKDCGEPNWVTWHDEKTLNLCQNDDQGNSVIFHYHIEKQVKKEILNINKEIAFAQEIKEGKWLLACKDNLRWDGLSAEEIEEEKNYFVCEEVPFWSDSSGYSDRMRTRLYLWENQELTRLTPEYMDVGSIKVYNDAYAVFFAQEFTDLRLTTANLFYMDLKSMKFQGIPEDKEYVYTDIVAAESDRIVVVRSDREKHGEYQNPYIDEIQLPTWKYRRINQDCEYHLCNTVLSDITYYAGCQSFIPWKNGVLFIATIIDEAQICFGDFQTGEIQVLTTKDMNILELALLDQEETLYFTALKGLGGPELWTRDMVTGKLERLTQWNLWLNQVYQESIPEPLTSIIGDGTEILGYVMKPCGFQKGEKYPTVLEIHGGPDTAYGRCYYHELQLWAAQGYGVIFCNPRGSIGRGADFSDLRGKYYTIDYDDIMGFVDTAIAKNNWIDEQRLAVMGGSYGGMMTNWIIGHTDRFKTAISDRCTVNELLDFFTSDIGLSFQLDTHGMLPWAEGGMEKLWEKAPLASAPNVKTPTLFIHGEKDYRCTKEQSLQMFAALKYHGVPAKVFMFKGESHGLCWYGAPKARVRRLGEMISWLEQYLK